MSITANQPMQPEWRLTMPDVTGLTDGFVVKPFWETRPGEEEAVAAILSRYVPRAREEPGVRCFNGPSVTHRILEVLLLRGLRG